MSKKCECGNKIFEEAFDGATVEWVWKCTECGATKPKGKRPMPKLTESYDGVPCTPAQKKTLEALREKILQSDGDGENWEYKRFVVTPFLEGTFLNVETVVGQKNDENTVLYFGRTHRIIFVGERGGCELANPLDSRKKGKIKGLQESITTSAG